jgi:hypothetical protein
MSDLWMPSDEVLEAIGQRVHVLHHGEQGDTGTVRRFAEQTMERMAYSWIEEIVERLVDVVATPWPTVDDQGRVTFSEASVHYTVQSGTASRIFAGPPEVGQVFALNDVAREQLRICSERLRDRLTADIHDDETPDRRTIDTAHEEALADDDADDREEEDEADQLEELQLLESAVIVPLTADARRAAKAAFFAAVAPPEDGDADGDNFRGRGGPPPETLPGLRDPSGDPQPPTAPGTRRLRVSFDLIVDPPDNHLPSARIVDRSGQWSPLDPDLRAVVAWVANPGAPTPVVQLVVVDQQWCPDNPMPWVVERPPASPADEELLW